jgi:hypothetical protein
MTLYQKFLECENPYFDNQTILTFAGPCIVTYFYSKTNQMQNALHLFYFGTTLYMFQTVSPPIIRSLRLYIQHQVYVKQVLWLLASGDEMEMQMSMKPWWNDTDRGKPK